MRILAIDPGLSGAACVLEWPQNLFEVRRDFKELGDIAQAIRELSPDVDYGVLELVSAMPGQGVSSMFSFGRSTGVAMGALYTLGIEFIEVAPVRWQNYWRCVVGWEGEFDSRAIACRVYGDAVRSALVRKKDHGSADAFLLAGFAASEIFAHGHIETSRGKGRGVIGGPARLNASDALESVRYQCR